MARCGCMKPLRARSIFILAGALTLFGCVEPVAPALDEGTVLSVGPADMPGENTGVGGVAGAVAGGVIGSRFGGGWGKVATTVGGAIAGGAAGTAVETSLQTSSGLRYTVKLDRGYVLTIVQHRDSGDPVFQPGTRVRVETTGHAQRVLPIS